MTPLLVFVLAAVTAAVPAASAAPANLDELASQVRAAEIAFAKSMADRDHAAFVSHLSDEAVFFSAKLLRGKAAVAEGWKPLFEGAKAPFSWEPENVAVIESGTLGISSGPVRDTDGKRVGTYNSIWRREAGGQWKILFDNGCPPCNCDGQGKTPGQS